MEHLDGLRTEASHHHITAICFIQLLCCMYLLANFCILLHTSKPEITSLLALDQTLVVSSDRCDPSLGSIEDISPAQIHDCTNRGRVFIRIWAPYSIYTNQSTLTWIRVFGVGHPLYGVGHSEQDTRLYGVGNSEQDNQLYGLGYKVAITAV